MQHRRVSSRSKLYSHYYSFRACNEQTKRTQQQSQIISARKGNSRLISDTVTSPPQSTRSAERNSQKNNKARKGLSGGAIAGIVIAVVVVLVLVGLALFFYLRWQREKKRAALSREIAPSPPEAPPDYSAHQTNGEARNGEGEIVDMYRGQNVGAVPPVVEVKKDDDGPRRVTPQEMESGRDAVPRVEVAGDHPIEPGARTAARAELPA